MLGDGFVYICDHATQEIIIQLYTHFASEINTADKYQLWCKLKECYSLFEAQFIMENNQHMLAQVF
jgi:hypothetical protein